MQKQDQAGLEIKIIKTDDTVYPVALDLRYSVFFESHGLPRSILFDELESNSIHVVLIRKGCVVAYGRLTKLDSDLYQISQIVVKQQEQNKGYGSRILNELIILAKKADCSQIILNARVTATGLYKRMGFYEKGKIFLSNKTGVKHIKMSYQSNKS